MTEYSEVKEKASLKDYANQYLEHVGNGLVCPVCASGKGPNRTPALRLTGERWRCFACNSGGDVFDLAGAIHHTDDKKEQLSLVKEWLGLADSSADSPKPNTVQGGQRTSGNSPSQQPNEAKTCNQRYIAQCQANINDKVALSYLEARGIDEITAKHEGFGYDPVSRRLVIPWKGSRYYWIARDVTGESTRKYDKPKSAEVGPQPLWNPDALKADSYFVVEGPMDALAIARLGFEAVALGGVGTGTLVEEASRLRTKACAILMLDSDEPGQKAQERARIALEKAGIPYIDYHGERFAKDADEMWQADPDRLKQQLQLATLEANDMAHQIETERQAGLFRTLRPVDAKQTALELLSLPGRDAYIPTGIQQLDAMLDGGLRPGLYVLAAASSLGKTTLASQIADYIALQGRDVLYVTLEQSAKDLVAKSVARLAFQSSKGAECIPTREMGDAGRRDAWSPSRREAFVNAAHAYADNLASHVEVLEGVGRTTAVDIAGYAACMDQQGRKPVVFVDYLQLLSSDATQDERLSISRSISDLRQLARDLDTPVVCISAVRREAYLTPVTLDSMKESGAIEYGADTVLGLQVAGVDMGQGAGPDRKAKSEADRRSRQGRAADVREVELVVLKQRDGRVHGPNQAIRLSFLPQASVFM